MTFSVLVPLKVLSWSWVQLIQFKAEGIVLGWPLDPAALPRAHLWGNLIQGLLRS